MRKLKVVATAFVFMSVLNLAAQSAPRWDRDRERYPGTIVADGRPAIAPCDSTDKPVTRHQKVAPTKSVVEQATAAINPHDVDYGGLLAEWRLAAVQETIEHVYYWTIIVLGLTCAGLLILLMFKEREKDRRLAITADVVAQLFNAWAYANYTARTTIAKHNQWVTRLNHEYEATLRGTPDMRPPAVASLPIRSPESDNGDVEDDAGSLVRESTAAVVNSETASRDASGALNRSPNSPSSIPSLAAAEYASGLVDTPKFFGEQLRKTAQVEPRAINVDAALTSVNEAAVRAIHDSDAEGEGTAESSADELKRLRAQVGAMQSKISAQQQQLNRDRERRAREEGKLTSGQGLAQ